MIQFKESAAGVSFAVRVQPRARRTALAGVLDGAIKIALAAPPVDGKANEALIRFLAELLGVSRSAVEIVSGDTSRNKVVRISGVSIEQLQQRLEDSR
ncbi:MAG TPA: DUF167 domain-containing protein [Alloacidobacterium sp.]|nr:DUF167 domain-containing protein [Alloacidobacterium sp.]